MINAVRTTGPADCTGIKTAVSEAYLGTPSDVRLTSFPQGHFMDLYFP